MPYLLIRQVVLPIARVKVETSILPRNLVPHGVFKGVIVDKRHSRSLGVVDEKVTSELLGQMTLTTFGFIGSRESDDCHTSTSTDPHLLCS